MRPEKSIIVDELQAKLNASPFLLVTDYTKLNVGQFTELRKRLSGASAECHVVKNTFFRKAAANAGLPEMGELKGQTAVVYGDKDVAAAAKILKSFVAEFQKPAIKFGVVGRVVVSADEVKAIADLPSREILLSQLLGTLQSPASTLVRLLNEPASALARVLKAKAESAPAAAEAPAPEPAAAAAPVAEAPVPAPAAEQAPAPAAEAAPAPEPAA